MWVASSRESRGSNPSRARSVDDDSGGYKIIKGDKSVILSLLQNFWVDELLLRLPLLKSWLYAKLAHKQLSNLCITVTGYSLAELCTQACRYLISDRDEDTIDGDLCMDIDE